MFKKTAQNNNAPGGSSGGYNAGGDVADRLSVPKTVKSPDVIDGAGSYMPRGVSDRETAKANRRKEQIDSSESKSAFKEAQKKLASEAETAAKRDAKMAEDKWRAEQGKEQQRRKQEREERDKWRASQRKEQLQIKMAQQQAKDNLEKEELAYARHQADKQRKMNEEARLARKKLDQSESNKRLEETRGGKQWHQRQQHTGSQTDVDEYNKWRDFKRDMADAERKDRQAAQKEANRIRKEEIDQRNAAKAKAAEDERRDIREAAARAKAAKEADEKKAQEARKQMMKEREADKKELKEIKQAQTRADEKFEQGKLQYDKDQAEMQRRMNHEAASKERQEAASGSKTKWSERREVQSQISRSMKEQELEWYKNSGCKSF